MPWHHHFPTFKLHGTALVNWYQRRDLFEKAAINLVGWAGVVLYFYTLLFAPVPGYTTGVYIRISPGMPLQEIAQTLEQRGVVSDAWRFKVATKILGDDRRIPAGEYYFSRQDNMIWIALRVLNGDFETTPIRITIIEGSTNNDIAKLLLERVPEFNRREFLESAKEGYLFPDTYFFRPGQSTEAILSVFENNFRVRMLKIQKEIATSGHTLDELVIMASLLEKEANSAESRRMISGVLWHRIDIGMPLQVDAVFPYIIGKNTYELTLQDLKIDSPYNTYKYKGLPIGPIANPGLDAILAAAMPTKNSYIFYLSDSEGKFHYARTYAEHMVNRAKYIGS